MTNRIIWTRVEVDLLDFLRKITRELRWNNTALKQGCESLEWTVLLKSVLPVHLISCSTWIASLAESEWYSATELFNNSVAEYHSMIDWVYHSILKSHLKFINGLCDFFNTLTRHLRIMKNANEWRLLVKLLVINVVQFAQSTVLGYHSIPKINRTGNFGINYSRLISHKLFHVVLLIGVRFINHFDEQKRICLIFLTWRWNNGLITKRLKLETMAEKCCMVAKLHQSEEVFFKTKLNAHR